MDIGRPSFAKTPGTHKIMDIPRSSFEDTVPRTEVYSDVAFRRQKFAPENFRTEKCILKIQDPERKKTWISGDRRVRHG